MPEQKIRGLLLSYGYCEEQRMGVDPWVLVDEDQYFTNPWDAIGSLATELYCVFQEEMSYRTKTRLRECCSKWATLRNGDVFTTLTLSEQGLYPQDAVKHCLTCRSELSQLDYNHEHMRGWLLDEYHNTPGSGMADYESHEDIWCRDTCLEFILDPEYTGQWYIVSGADLVLSLGIPEPLIPEGSKDAYLEDFDHNFHSFDDDLRQAFKAWRPK